MTRQASLIETLCVVAACPVKESSASTLFQRTFRIEIVFREYCSTIYVQMPATLDLGRHQRITAQPNGVMFKHSCAIEYMVDEMCGFLSVFHYQTHRSNVRYMF
jgi:hypothetical protein